MNAEQITNFLENKASGEEKYVKIAFKTREPVLGLFITKTPDYKELSTKNFWRIVTKMNFENYRRTGSLEYSRLFSGSDFTKLSLLSEEY